MGKLSSTVIYGSLLVSHDIRTASMIYVNNNIPVWHAGNDGSGSGLDADTVDGLHFRVNATILEISTNGTSWTPVSMTANDILTQIKTVDGTGSGLDADTVDGLHFRVNASILELSTNGTTWTPVSMTAADILTQIKTVDGTGSGLDADTVDGLQATALIQHSLATAVNDFLVASGSGAFVKKTLAETKTILGIVASSDTVSGIVELATAAEVTTGTDTTRAVTPAGLKVELDKKANLASPALTGTPTSTTAAPGTNTTQIATTAFVAALGALKANLAGGNTFTGLQTVDNLKVVGTTKTAGHFYAGTTAPTNVDRLNYDGYFYTMRSFNAVYNDLAEFMEFEPTQVLQAGDVLSSTANGLVKAKYGDRNVVGVYSDTYGYALGAENIEVKVPIGISGRVLTYIENPEDIEPGRFVVAGNTHAIATETYVPGTVVGKIFDGVKQADGRYWVIIALM